MSDTSTAQKNYSIQLTPLAKTFVMEVKGLDLSQELSEEVCEKVINLLAEHQVLVFRNQRLTEERQEAIMQELGHMRDQKYHVWTPLPDEKAAVGRDSAIGPLPVLNKGNVLFFVNGPDLCEGERDPSVAYSEKELDSKGGTSCWHTGDTEKANVEVVNALTPIIVPEKGGQTLFLDATAAYEDLDQASKDKCDTIRVIHCMVFPEVEGIDMPEPTPPVSQPLVKQHSVTGKKFLYLNFHDMERVEGMSREESYELIKSLFDHATQLKYRYDHTWCEGDFVLWNCNGTLHRKGVLVPGVKRALRRTQVAVPALQSTREWDKTRMVEDHDGEYWHPYPFER